MGFARAAATIAAAAGALAVTLAGLAVAASADGADPGPTAVRGVAVPGARYGPFALDTAPTPAPAPLAAPATPVTASFAASGVPARVLQAYRAAAAAADPACRLEWPLLAAVGHVESGHARGGRLDAAGRTVSPIVGPALDGTPGVRAIPDSDGGRLDGDPVWDRAVGPMQFIPGTWAVSGADGDGDGRADPHQVDDATHAAARYLCAGGGDLSTPGGALAALLRYNASDAYARRVLGLAGSYRDGVPVRPDVPLPGPGGPGALLAGALVPGPAVPAPPPLLAPGAVVPPPAGAPAPLPGAVPPVPPATPAPGSTILPPTTTAPEAAPETAAPATTAPATTPPPTQPTTPPPTTAPSATSVRPTTTAPTTTAPSPTTSAPATTPSSGTGSTTSDATGTGTTSAAPDASAPGAAPPAGCLADAGTADGCTAPAP